MRIPSILAAGWGLIALPLAAQQSDSTARALHVADSIARWRADSANVAKERQRIMHEPRAHPPAPLPPPPIRLTKQQAIDSALAHNPTIVIAREQVAQANARVTQATAFPDPTLGFTVQGPDSAIYPHPASRPTSSPASRSPSRRSSGSTGRRRTATSGISRRRTARSAR